MAITLVDFKKLHTKEQTVMHSLTIMKKDRDNFFNVNSKSIN